MIFLTSHCSFISVVHCHCSKCYSVPARKRVRKRTPALSLLSLPEEVLLCVLQCLSAEDLLSVRAVSKHTAHTSTLLHNLSQGCAKSPQICSGLCILWPPDSIGCSLLLKVCLSCCLLQVHSQLRDIVDNHSSVWARVSFRDTWPSPNTLWLFERYDQLLSKSQITNVLFLFSMGVYLKHLLFQSRWERELWSCCEARDCLFVQWRT